MDEETPQSKAAYYRGFARTLQGIADNLLDLRRKAQLRALAAGFERYADRVEQAFVDGITLE